MKSCITIALVPSIRTGPWVYWDDLEKSMRKATTLGFDGVELFTASADALDIATVRHMSQETGLSLLLLVRVQEKSCMA